MKHSKIKQRLYRILILWIPINFVLGVLFGLLNIELPISEERVIFFNSQLQSLEETYNGADRNKVFYEDKIFKIITMDNYISSVKSTQDRLGSSNIVVYPKLIFYQYVFYRDTIDKCRHGYYEVTYNPFDNKALCMYTGNGSIRINLSRTKIIKTLKN